MSFVEYKEIAKAYTDSFAKGFFIAPIIIIAKEGQ